MTQNNGFLGTIGWIKSNLMVSSQASEKGYSNENFYPGSDNIPESEPKVKVSFPYEVVGELNIDNKFNASGFSQHNYIKLGNIPDLTGDYKLRLAFTITGPIQPTTTSNSASVRNIPVIWNSPQSEDNYSRLGCKMSATKQLVKRCEIWLGGSYNGLRACEQGVKYYVDAQRIYTNTATNTATITTSMTNATTGQVLVTNTQSWTNHGHFCIPLRLSGSPMGYHDACNFHAVISPGYLDGVIHLAECYFEAL